MISHTKDLFNLYVHMYPHERVNLGLLEGQMQEQENIFSRKNFRGHVTASGLVVLNNSVLLIFHNFLKKFLQPGGHIEDDKTLIASAAREVYEETGVNTSPHLLTFCDGISIPIFINSHHIPRNDNKGEPEHLHHDFIFLFTTEKDTISLDTEEVASYKWVGLDNEFEEGALKIAIDKFRRLSK